MEIQLQKLSTAKTWTLVHLPPGKRAIQCKWIYNYKEGAKANAEHDILENARLVARGDLQSKGVDYMETFTPVVKLGSLRLLLTYAAKHDLDIVHWDVVAAFLTGDLTEEVYMRQPPGFDDGNGRVCKLNKSIYGLCQSARVFFQKLDQLLTKDKEWRRLHTEWALWKHSTSDALIGSHVDDFCVVGRLEIRERLKGLLEANELVINDFGPIDFYLGIHIQRDRTTRRLYLSQQDYAMKVVRDAGMHSCNPASTPMSNKTILLSTSTLLAESDKKRYQRVIGSLLYLMQATRPDLAFAVIRLSQFASSPCQAHAEALKRILRYLKGTINAKLILGDLSSTDVVGYFDAAYADTIKRHSTCGYIFHYFGSPVSWSSKVQRTIALSTVESEYMAATEAAREVIWIQSVIDAMTSSSVNLPISLYGDNNGAIALSKNPEFHPKTKHIDVRHRFITELVGSGVVTVKYIPTESMLADGFTKPLTPARHWHDFQELGVLFGGKWTCSDCQLEFDDRYHFDEHIK